MDRNTSAGCQVNCLVKKARHLTEMFSRCLQGFYKSKQKCLTKALTKAS